MANFYNDVTKQNVTELVYKNTLINNTDVQTSEALSDLVCGIFEQLFTDTTTLQTALANGNVTEDTYVLVDGPPFAPRLRFVDTVKRILDNY